MKIYSSKKIALNNINVTNYKTRLYCTGEYKTSIKEMNVILDNVKALYKTYHKDYHGRYVKIHYIYEVE